MPMLGSRLKTAAQLSIYNRLKALQEPKIPADADAGQRSDINQSWLDLSDAMSDCMADIVSEIVSNAQITTSVTVASVSGVMTGPGVSGPGTGSGTGTVS